MVRGEEGKQSRAGRRAKEVKLAAVVVRGRLAGGRQSS